MIEIQACSLCGDDAIFEREWIEQPQEGEVCCLCGSWVCANCVDWSKSDPDPICKTCGATL